MQTGRHNSAAGGVVVALAIAALRADGTTTIVGAHHVDRGYDGFVEKLQTLGADIRRV